MNLNQSRSIFFGHIFPYYLPTTTESGNCFRRGGMEYRCEKIDVFDNIDSNGNRAWIRVRILSAVLSSRRLLHFLISLYNKTTQYHAVVVHQPATSYYVYRYIP